MKKVIDRETNIWGVRVLNTEVKDVKLPPKMQRAKIISSQGEVQAAENLQKAAMTLNDGEGAMQLRYLQTLRAISTENNSTIVFPMPIDLNTTLSGLASG